MEQKKIKWEDYKFSFNTIENYEDDEILLMNSPMGVFRIDDTMNPFRRFKFKMGHTNFDITDSVLSSIENARGVEALIIVSRYRFIIAAGEIFSMDSVTKNIDKILCQHKVIRAILSMDLDDNVRARIIQVYDQICSSKYWAMCILPNGEIDYCKYKTDCKEFRTKINLYTQSSNLCESVVVSSENDNEYN